MRVLRVLAVALATQRTTDVVKEAIPAVPPPIATSLFAGGLSLGLTLLTERRPKAVLIEAVAAAGLASILHDAQTAAQRWTDNQIIDVLAKTPQSTARQPRRTTGLGN